MQAFSLAKASRPQLDAACHKQVVIDSMVVLFESKVQHAQIKCNMKKCDMSLWPYNGPLGVGIPGQQGDLKQSGKLLRLLGRLCKAQLPQVLGSLQRVDTDSRVEVCRKHTRTRFRFFLGSVALSTGQEGQGSLRV